MFKVQPLRSREIQAKLAAALGVAYYENTYAFFAIDLPDTDSPDANAEADAAVLGLCQFTFAPEGAVIRSIAAAPGKKEDEAMVILVRAVMNFCYRAELPLLSIAVSNDPNDLTSDPSFVKSLGFCASSDYTIDLKEFYRSPCHYNGKE